MTDSTHDIIVVGGGTAGLVTAAGAALLGARPALVEQEALGGDCLWTGCVPTKALIAHTRWQHDAGPAGTGAARPGATPWDDAVAWLRTARERVARHDDPERFRGMGVDVILSPARFTGPGQLATRDRTLRAKRIVVATGSTPLIPPIPGLAEAGFLTHVTAYDHPVLPASIAILGGGPIGLEFAQVYARLGAHVTVLELGDEVLPKEDAEVARYVRDRLIAEGVTVHTGFRANRVEREGHSKAVVAADGRRIVAAELFVAVGRRPQTADLELERAGVELDERGAVRVNQRLRTTARGVWAAGDVTGGLQFTHVADYEARLVVRNALTPFAGRADYAAVPWVTFTDPEVARVGPTADEAEAAGLRPRVYRADFEHLDRAIVDGATAGFAKVVARPSGRILGATVVGRGAGELIMEFVLAVRHRLSLSDVSAAIHPYPTMSEIARRAADAYGTARLAGPAGRWLRRIVRWWC